MVAGSSPRKFSTAALGCAGREPRNVCRSVIDQSPAVFPGKYLPFLRSQELVDEGEAIGLLMGQVGR